MSWLVFSLSDSESLFAVCAVSDRADRLPFFHFLAPTFCDFFPRFPVRLYLLYDKKKCLHFFIIKLSP